MLLLQRITVFLFVLIGGYACQPSPAPPAGVPLTLATHRKAQLSNVRYQLNFDIPAEKDKAIPATATIEFTSTKDSGTLALDFKQPAGSVQTVEVNGVSIKVRQENEHLLIPGEKIIEGVNTLQIAFRAGNDALNRNGDYMYALFVPERARTAFPCFDQPDLKATFALTLTIPQGWQAMSNGPLQKITTADDKTTWSFAPSGTIPTYLFSFTAGRYQVKKMQAGGREMEFFYRETDSAKLAASIPAIFDLHAQSLQWLEGYTAISYPFQKFSFAAIPDFQFGGMEHPGAIWYNANSLFLDSSATRTQLIRRASLIGHETAHMWFGDLVTMQWFNDVWMKEVFANFMADKIVAKVIPDDNAAVKFITDHYPAAYSVDRTKGANPIRQPLDNLNEAGSLYGNIIYHKAPIMMQQLERLIGEESLQKGLQQYLRRFAYSNATWPDLIAILDSNTTVDLQAWNDQWVNKAGRPIKNEALANAQGDTYGLFTIDTTRIAAIYKEPDAALRALQHINLFENVIDGRGLTPLAWMAFAQQALMVEKDELINQLLLGQLQSIWWVYLTPDQRVARAEELQTGLLNRIASTEKPGMKKQFFKTYTNIAITVQGMNTLMTIWLKKEPPAGVKLTDDDYTDLAAGLALRSHPQTKQILRDQLARISNPDKKLRWEYLQPALSPDSAERDRFFAGLKDLANRKKEAWVVTAVGYLHHPLRGVGSVKYIRPSLDLLEELQRTGDIFFPYNFLQATLGMHQTAEAAAAVQSFIDAHPGYNSRLMNKLLQTADPLMRARALLEKEVKK
ncbi:M1 family metallopeptidase [Paraflavitalea pollutisoli]|uniref:M1 family metallopeptidase n=1 Tax=Paraflavitalea pollutisoli TaxID=3034143 RepID=UPI0023EB12AE|nr:M1 family aminopeptidase [Paraflavitalea sp. H1-2-19X]